MTVVKTAYGWLDRLTINRLHWSRLLLDREHLGEGARTCGWGIWRRRAQRRRCGWGSGRTPHGPEELGKCSRLILRRWRGRAGSTA